MKRPSSRRLAALLVGLAMVAIGGLLIALLWRLHLPYVNTVIGLALGCFGLAAVVVVSWKLISALLYKVGRRLAFSYFLIGVLPIPMVMLVLGVVAYLLASFFIGHLYRDALRSLDSEVAATTRERAAIYQRTGRPSAMPAAAEPVPGMVYAYYQDGKRVAGDNRAPASWPSWAQLPAPGSSQSPSGAAADAATGPASGTATAPAAGVAAGAATAPPGAAVRPGAFRQPGAAGATAAYAATAGPAAATSLAAGPAAPARAAPALLGSALPPIPRFFSRPDHSSTLAAAAGSSRRGVIGLYAGNLDLELSRRSDLWIETNRPEDPNDVMQVKLGSHELPMLTFHRAHNVGEAQRFFKRRSQGEWFWDHQLLWWGQASGQLLDLADGHEICKSVLVNLNGTPRVLKTHLFTANGEIDAASWALLVGLAFLLTNVYAVATLMALFMIVGLSRAVNRLSRATDAVRRGDFSARIPVRRRDQVGVLQRSFNEMAGNLEMLVAASAQKELLEKELALARDLQNSLIPSNLPSGEGVEFATLFEPSAAIGGDYFDVLRLSERELAVIIADVSGHGLSTGLRMAMLKAALLILIEETRKPEEILRRLDSVVRSNAESRCFVTATLATFDVREGRLTLTNAGHPPTYLVRNDGAVEEILLPSSPLGGLGHRYERRELMLDRGDIVVWLSDGLFEEVDEAGEPFGYDRILTALSAGAKIRGGGGGASGRAAARAGRPGGELTAAMLRDRLLAAVAAHVGAQPPNDDRTLVVMRWLGPVPVPALAAAVPAAAGLTS